jgi:hypothetical protein
MILSELHAQARLNLLNNAYFSPRHRLLYVATPKVACTSFKWWFAELLGVKSAIEQSTNSMESDPELVIHDNFARVAPEFTGVNEAGLLEALSSPDYFRFCLVRNPYTRIFSAWQSKWLLHESLQASFYPDMVGGPFIESVSDIRKSFEGFLRFLVNMGSDSDWDVHVAPQVALLEPERIAYQMMAHIEDTATLVQALAVHVGPGFRDPLCGTRANVSLLSYSATWISDESAELIRMLYARDFEVFGYDTAVPAGANALSDDALAMALRSIKVLRGRNVRIGELVARFSTARLVHLEGAAVQSTLQLYWSDLQDGVVSPYTEERSAFDVYQVDGGRKIISLAFPLIQQPVIRLRLDPANQPLVIMIHALKLESADGDLLWNWGGEQNAFLNLHGLALRNHDEGMMALSLSNDPQCELNIPDELLAQVRHSSRLILEITAMPLHEGCADVIKADVQLIAELRAAATGDSVGAAATSAEAQSSVHCCTMDIVNIAALFKSSLALRDQTIAEQSKQIRAMRNELLRAEAQLNLLKELMLGNNKDELL